MQAGCFKYGIIISRLPVVHVGVGSVIKTHFPEYELSYCRSHEDLTLFQLRRAMLVVVDLSGELHQPREICEQYYDLLAQYRDIHWVFLISRPLYPLAIEFLMRPESSLLFDQEPVEQLVRAICDGASTERVRQTLLMSDLNVAHTENNMILTISERQVLRLLAKGWGINQIAMLLKKSNKTVSAQKNSAMRRLALRSNAEMYAWINSEQGMKALSLPSAYGEQVEWKRTPQYDMSLS